MFVLAGGIAFSLILALIPLLVLTISVATFFFEKGQTITIPEIVDVLSNAVPMSDEAQRLLTDLLFEVSGSTSGAVSIGVIAFIWLTTRLFGSLRVALSDVFDIEDTRNILQAKLFDMRISLISSLFLAGYIFIRTYLAVNVQGQFRVTAIEGWILTFVAFAFILLTFFLLYRYLPSRRVRWRTAFVAALFTSVLFEVARYVFTLTLPFMNPGSMYSGVIAALVVPVVWSYYVALIFILGGEVAQVYDLLRVRRIQRVVFE